MIQSQEPPVVELDSQAHAAYVRFSSKEVAETELIMADNCVVTMDRDKDGEVVGVEFVGVDEFTIEPLLRHTPRLEVPHELLERTRYVPVAQPVPA